MKNTNIFLIGLIVAMFFYSRWLAVFPILGAEVEKYRSGSQKELVVSRTNESVDYAKNTPISKFLTNNCVSNGKTSFSSFD